MLDDIRNAREYNGKRMYVLYIIAVLQYMGILKLIYTYRLQLQLDVNLKKKGKKNSLNDYNNKI